MGYWSNFVMILMCNVGIESTWISISISPSTTIVKGALTSHRWIYWLTQYNVYILSHEGGGVEDWSALYCANHVIMIVNNINFKRVDKLILLYHFLEVMCRRISYVDCIPLIEVISERISNWKSKFPSYASQIEIICSIFYRIIMFNIFCHSLLGYEETRAAFIMFLW